jgi:parvulin-like peptidyl-prolyl isomerase
MNEHWRNSAALGTGSHGHQTVGEEQNRPRSGERGYEKSVKPELTRHNFRAKDAERLCREFPRRAREQVGRAFALVVMCLAATATAQHGWERQALAADTLDSTVAARVDGEPVYVREVKRELGRVIGDRQTEPAALKLLQAQTLEQLIGRRLILRYLAAKKLGPSPADINLALERVKTELKQQNLTLEEYLQRSGLDQSELRHTLAWQAGWQRYLDRYMTDENLERWFDTHRREFDGSEIKAAHILFKVEPRDDAKAQAAALERARQVRDEIESGKLDFAAAAAQHSAAPTGRNGGDIGFIQRHQPMPEPFSRAAFALEKGDISQPVITPFGVHLIRCLDIKPGQIPWQQSRGSLKAAVTQYLFDWVAGQQRADSKIEFTGALPHFKPGTSELAESTQ